MAKHIGNPDFRSDLTNNPELLPDEARQYRKAESSCSAATGIWRST
ncbi:hypothetical protein WAK64_03885 [Bacillus spongiae]|uniref:Uncharacterized protein n=1 Tax=Bacillus spongiae TaxID=2683610 RepID=A0ABU8HA90_9BACI